MTRLFEYLFSNPLVMIPSAAKYLGVTYPVGKNAVEALEGMGIFIEQGGRERGRIFAYHELLKILS